MRGVDAAVDHRHHSAGAVEAGSPGLVGADERDAVPQNRLVDPVFYHALHRKAGRVKRFERRWTDSERDQWRRQVST